MGACYARTLSPLWRWGRSVVSVGWHSTPDDSVRVHDWWFVCVCGRQKFICSFFLLLSFLHIPELWPLLLVPISPVSSPALLSTVRRHRRPSNSWLKWSKKNKNPNFSGSDRKAQAFPQGQRSSLERPSSICYKCQMSHSCVPRISRTSWKAGPLEMEGDDVPRQTLPLRRGHSAALTKFFPRKTHAWIIPLYMPPCVAWFCFSLCKITVVQVFRRRRHVDGLARKRTAKHLCSPQRSFLSYNRLSCPEWIFGFTARPSSVSRLQRTVEGAFQDDRLSLSKGRGCTRLVDSSASREIATGTWTGQTGRKRREAARRKAVERRGLESMPGRRWAAL